MNIVLHGIGLGGGIVIGQAVILDKDIDNATEHTLEEDEIDHEVMRFQDALANTRTELEILRNKIPVGAPTELGAFLSLSIMMLSDSHVAQIPINIIREEMCNAEWALKLQADRISAKFDDMEDDYLKERKHDAIQVLERIFKNLTQRQFDWKVIGKNIKNAVLITHDLAPADLLEFKDSNLHSFVTEVGSLTSHTAIIGKNLAVPAIVGVPFARQLIFDDDMIIVDGVHGVLVINPDESLIKEYTKFQSQLLESKEKLKQIRKNIAKSIDGIHIDLFASIESFNDVANVKYNYANGIGLFRSEFTYLDKENHMATEDEQFEIYSKVASSMKKQPVVIRTADLGVDKNPIWNMDNDGITNPAMGLIGIRLSLSDTNFFKTQLRAILRASFYGNIKIMFPMTSSSWELSQAIAQLNDVKYELTEEGISFNEDIKVGAMIEIPSAALSIKSILKLVDFVSIGTNDLIQYLLAIDRNDELVSYLYNPLHPAVLKLINYVVSEANKQDKEVSLCGEMAGDPRLIRLLLGIGIRQLSMHSNNLLAIKNIVLKTDIERGKSIISKIMRTEDADKIESLVEELNLGLDI